MSHGALAVDARHEANRQSWNAATAQHRTHKPALVADYCRGFCKLFPEDHWLLTASEATLRGPMPSATLVFTTDGVAAPPGALRGLDVVHLQCNDGQDTVSIATSLGPATVVGVDISDTAIALANELRDAMLASGRFEDPLGDGAAAATTHVSFERADVVAFAADPRRAATADVVFVSYGALCWQADVGAFCRAAASLLRPGGRLVIIDFHATGMSADFGGDASDCADAAAPLTTLRDHTTGGACTKFDDGVGDYVGDDFEGAFRNPHASFEFAWGVGDVATAALAAGLRIAHLSELPYSNGYRCHPAVVPSVDGVAPATAAQVAALEAGVATGPRTPQAARYVPPPHAPRLR